MSDYRPGDVLATPYRGTTRYVRITLGHHVETVENPNETPRRIYVQDCDGAGFLLNGEGRYLQTRTLDIRYRLHHRPEAKDQP